MNHFKRIAAAALLLASGSVYAEDEAPKSEDPAPKYGGLGLRFGTAGIGLDYTYGINRWLDVRAGYHFGAYSYEQEEDDIEYEAELKISALALMLDVKPFAGGFRISLGAFSSPPEFDLRSEGLDDYELGESTYTGDLRIDGGIDLGSTAPYVGLGWGGTTNASGFGASFDIGVMFAKAPDVSLDITGRACDSTNGDCDPNGAEGFDIDDPNDARAQQFQADKDEEIRNLEDDAKEFDLWPVLMFGLHYRF